MKKELKNTITESYANGYRDGKNNQPFGINKFESKNIMEIYDKLREAHSIVLDIFNKNKEKMTNLEKNSIVAVSEVMYVAEGLFTDF